MKGRMIIKQQGIYAVVGVSRLTWDVFLYNTIGSTNNTNKENFYNSVVGKRPITA